MIIKPAPWIAFRTYKAPSGKVRSIIMNNLTFQKTFLEDEAALMWSRIENGDTEERLYDYAESLDCADELHEFLDSLRNLLIIDAPESSTRPEGIRPPAAKDLEYAANVADDLDFTEWVLDAGFMFAVQWELTYRCNESCIHCYNPGAAHIKGEKNLRNSFSEVSTNRAFEIIDELSQLGVFELTLSGGEVTLRKDFFEILSYARSKGFDVSIFTNALKFSDSMIDQIASYWPSSIGVSIYSNDSSTHDEITRVPGSHESSLRALQRFHDLGIKTNMKSILMKHTLPEHASIKDLAINVGAVPQVEMNLSNGVDGANAPAMLAVDNFDELVLVAATPGSPLFVGGASENFGEVHKDMNSTPCAAGLSGLTISSEGNIYPCTSLPIESGNILSDSISEIWKTALSQRKYSTTSQKKQGVEYGSVKHKSAVLAEWQDIRLRDYEECGTHRRCRWCAKCAGLAYLEKGRELASSSVNCLTASARMTAADYLRKGHNRDSIALELSIDRSFGYIAPRATPKITETNRISVVNIDG